MNNDKLQEIYNSFINGQKKQAVELINEYGRDRFWIDYICWLVAFSDNNATEVYTTHSITYHTIMQGR